MPSAWSFKMLKMGPSSEARGQPVGTTSDGIAAGDIQLVKPKITVAHRKPSTLIHPTPHLLNLPFEVRQGVWKAILVDVMFDAEFGWHSTPSTAWDGLFLTCHQIRSEIAEYWPCIYVPKGGVVNFLTQPYSAELFNNFSRLSLELPLSLHPSLYQDLARALIQLVPCLQDLRIFFVGKDKFGIKTGAHGCASRELPVKFTSKRLTIDAQYLRERQPLFSALFYLENLRSLVLKNTNYPVLQSMILKHKRLLQHLYISNDCRATLHAAHQLESNEQALIIPPNKNFPPVKVLHIAANAALSALQVVGKLAATLEELNWTVPDNSLQLLIWDWLSESGVMLRSLYPARSRLRTLRMCFECPMYESHHSYGALVGALRFCLPRFTNLQTLELHFHSKSPYFGKEILCAIPSSVTRLYISDKLISAIELEAVVMRRCIDPTFQEGNHDRDLGNEVTEPSSCAQNWIPMHNKLGFITYEYTESRATRLTLYRINATLLDRERNRNLALYDGGVWIPPKVVPVNYVHDSALDRFLAPLAVKIKPWDDDVADLLGRTHEEMVLATKMLEFSGEGAEQFGNEDRAQEWFDREIPVKLEDLPEWHWPEAEEMAEKQHWMSEC